jgi:UPF0271 protein
MSARQKPNDASNTKTTNSNDGKSGRSIDINCDMGEGLDNDSLIMPHISSASIACGYHAGNENTMWNTVELAVKHQVSIGAHVSFLDRNNFGRKELDLSMQEVYDLVEQQLIILSVVTDSFDARINHVKPHGALYNMSARNKEMANTIARAVRDFDHTLILFGLSGSHSISEADSIGLKTASEAFADRTYQDDGQLTGRNDEHAVIEEEMESVKHVLNIINGKIISLSGKEIAVKADTICLHGDNSNATQLAVSISKAIRNEGILIRPVA